MTALRATQKLARAIAGSCFLASAWAGKEDTLSNPRNQGVFNRMSREEAPTYTCNRHGPVRGLVDEKTCESEPRVWWTWRPRTQHLARRGTTSFCPTTVTAALDYALRALEFLADVIEKRNRNGGELRARPIGIHTEGPFISMEKAGAPSSAAHQGSLNTDV